MQIVEQPISGAETIADTSSALAALVNFYSAFNNQDLELMEANWLQSEQASMSNPLGGLKRGWEEIKRVYENIFLGSALVYVEFYGYTIHESEKSFFVVGHERGSVQINNRKLELAIRTSRIYTLHDKQWKQIHHHGSMDDAQLLSRYQRAIIGK